MDRARRHYLLILVLLIALAFALRVYRLDAVPLRGDEAFTVRYWAAPPPDVIRDLARWEPHPLGAFFGFWAWKGLAGDSEFAMRYLPVLANLVGVAAMAALARRLFHDARIAVFVAAWWAVHPFLIWHAQDVRNYALWAAFSPLAMWLFLRAADTNRPREWVLYVVAEAVAVYTFFLEGFLLLIQAIYLLAFRRQRATLRRAAWTWTALSVLLISWAVQLWFLAHSGYTGATGQADPDRLLTWFLPTLLTGTEFSSPWRVVLPLAWCALVTLGLLKSQPPRRVIAWLALWALVPAGLLLIAATRMSVFHPRYLIAVMPALLLLTARAIWPGVARRSLILAFAGAALLITPLLGLPDLPAYYRGDAPKAPNWPALATYLDHRARPGDLILQALPDPAFGYYYRGGVQENSLIPGADIAAQLAPELNFYDTIWLVERAAEAEAYLSERLQTISQHDVAGFTVIQYRRWDVSPDEIAAPLDVTFGDVARLRGYTLQGPDPVTLALTVLLYWEPLAHSGADYHVFVHLLGLPHPATGSPLWDQDDHPLPRSTPGDLRRDPHHLLVDPGVLLAPGSYTITVGLYDPADPTARLPAAGADGALLGDSYPLVSLTLP